MAKVNPVNTESPHAIAKRELQQQLDTKNQELLTKLVKKIWDRLPTFSTKQKIATAIGRTGSALADAMNNGGSDTTDRYMGLLKQWLRDSHQLEAVFDKNQQVWELIDLGKDASRVESAAIVSSPLSFMNFMKEVQKLEGGKVIKIIGTWPSSIAEADNNLVIDELEKMIKHSKSVQLLLPKWDSRFYARRLYLQNHNKNDAGGEFEKNKLHLMASIKMFHELKVKINNPKAFDLRLYDQSPGIRMFAHGERIYVSLLLDGIESNATFSTIYSYDGSNSTTQLHSHFDQLWDNSSEHTHLEKSEKLYNLRLLGNIPGVYKVYTYGHIKEKEAPATLLGGMEICSNGTVRQRTFLRDDEKGKITSDLNEGWVMRVGDNLFMEVRNLRAPKYTAFSILRIAGGFEGVSGQYLFGTVIVPKKESAIPFAMRIILERQAVGVTLESLPCKKVALYEEIEPGLIPDNVRKMLSGIFRNMLRFNEAQIFNELSLAKEINNTKAKLGDILFAYAKILKLDNEKNDKEIINAVRWAMTNGFADCEMIETEFGALIKSHDITYKLFNRIKQDGIRAAQENSSL